jgi:hypothetical protein
MQNGNKLVFAVSAIISGIVGYAKDSSAFWTRQHYSDCQGDPESSSFYEGGNSLPANSLIVQCQTPDNSGAPKTSITSYNVHVEDNHPSYGIMAYRCVTYWSAVGGSCGSVVTTSGTGVTSLSPPTFAGWSAADFGYIYVILPPTNSSGVRSSIKGIYTAG